MTDPGAFSTLQNTATGINAVVITHEHQDHLHIESLKEVLKNNLNAIVITNSAVGKLLGEAGIPHNIIENGQTYDLKGVNITGFGTIHAEIYGEYGRVQNTGYMIGDLCFPGDAFEYPDTNTKVDILALPVAGPWMRIKDAIEYALALKPRIAFPVHDAILNQQLGGFVSKMAENFLAPSGIEFKALEINKEEEI